MARASFLDNEDDWKKYNAMKLRWSKLQNIGELKSSILSKSNALQDIQKTYTKTVAFKSADPAICALHKIGLAYDQLAEQLINFPMPKGLPEEVLIELRPQFEQQAEPVKKNAAEAFTAVVTKSQELDVFNPCTIAALEMLRNKYRPDAFPKMREDVMELKLAAEKVTVDRRRRAHLDSGGAGDLGREVAGDAQQRPRGRFARRGGHHARGRPLDPAPSKRWRRRATPEPRSRRPTRARPDTQGQRSER